MKSNAELRNVKKSCERMIRFLSILAALLVVICVNFGVGADQPLIQKSDLYWISYIGQNEDQSCCLLFLMQIDQFGNVNRVLSVGLTLFRQGRQLRHWIKTSFPFGLRIAVR